MAVFSWPVRVYYEDTDAIGVVYHANYLKFMERARSEWLRSLGVDQNGMRRDLDLVFAVRSIEVDYLRPAHFNDELLVSAFTKRVKAASVIMEQEIHRVGSAGKNTELLARGSVKLACMNLRSLRPVPLPESLMEAIVRVG